MKNKIIILGLTGSIGMGKSTVARIFKRCGSSLFDADECIRQLLETNKDTYHFFLRNYPEVFHAGRIARKRVAFLIFKSQKKRKEIESFLHPLVERSMLNFIHKAKTKIVVLEVPLLFETGFDKLCDVTVCVSASPLQQKERVLKRGRMTVAQLKSIQKRQLSNKEKMARADYVINTGTTYQKTKLQVEALYKDLKNA